MARSEPRVWENYWSRRQQISQHQHAVGLTQLNPHSLSSPVDQLWLREVKTGARILDVGSGDGLALRKLKSADWNGHYLSMDISPDCNPTYRSIEEVDKDPSNFGALDCVLCLDVLEHMTLEEGLKLISHASQWLRQGGVLVIQTPNGRSLRSPFGSDMTHVQIYNSADLWAVLKGFGFQVQVWRVEFAEKTWNPFYWMRYYLGRWITTRLLGADHADNLLFIAKKSDDKDQ